MPTTLKDHNEHLQSVAGEGGDIQKALKKHPGISFLESKQLADITTRLVDQEHDQLGYWVEQCREDVYGRRFGGYLIDHLEQLRESGQTEKLTSRARLFADESCLLDAIRSAMVEREDEILTRVSDIEIAAIENENNELHDALRDLRQAVTSRRQGLTIMAGLGATARSCYIVREQRWEK